LGGNVIVAKHQHVATLTLNRPPGNLVNVGLMTSLDKALRTVIKEDNITVIILTGGDKSFSEGIDLEAFRSLGDDEMAEFVRNGQETLWRLERAPKPTLAAMAGKVLGPGLEIALACDMRLSTENAQFGHPEVSQGLIPLFGDAVRLERVIGRSRARSLIFTGEPIHAWEALEIGLVGRIAPNDVLLEEARLAASRIVSQPLHAVQAAKAAMLATEDSASRKAFYAIIASLLKGSRERKRKVQVEHSANRE